MTAGDRRPELIERYLERALPQGALTARQVLVTQTGEMVMKRGGRALQFTAVERFAVDRVAFAWEARFRLVALIPIRVLDCYADGIGTLRVRALGIPIQARSGAEISVGEAYRYLAELPWVPQAMAANPELRWRGLDERRVEVTTAVADARAAVRLEFDHTGDVVRSVADARPRGDRTPEPSRWGGDFRDHGTLAGIRMPMRAAVYWDLPEGRFVYWRGCITSAEVVDQPFASS